MQKNDKAYEIINSSQMAKTLIVFGHNEKISSKILIIGGGNIGFNLAKILIKLLNQPGSKLLRKIKIVLNLLLMS